MGRQRKWKSLLKNSFHEFYAKKLLIFSRIYVYPIFILLKTDGYKYTDTKSVGKVLENSL